MGNTIICGKSQKSVPIRTRGRRQSQYLEVTPCKYCKNSFSEKRILEHETECHKNPLNTYLKCDNCRKGFNMVNYERHLKACNAKYLKKRTSCSTDGSGATGTYCDFCEAALNIETYGDHMKRCLQNPKNIRVPCPFCKELFAKDLLMKHKVFCVHNQENVKVACYGCKKEIKMKHYQIHLRECQDLSTMFSTQPEFECPICLGEIKQNEAVRSLPCRHKYHPECIADWCKKRNDCPVCRAKIKEAHKTNKKP